jgi:thousand and one amino acid protein kinase
LNIRARQIETMHALLLKHHELIKTQELTHFNSNEHLRRRHLDVQHESELSSQRDYNRRTLEEKAKEHAMQSKQQPRELKV